MISKPFHSDIAIVAVSSSSKGTPRVRNLDFRGRGWVDESGGGGDGFRFGGGGGSEVAVDAGGLPGGGEFLASGIAAEGEGECAAAGDESFGKAGWVCA